MERKTSRSEHGVVDGVADPDVREVEALADGVDEAPPHQLLDALGGLATGESRGLLQQGEAELPLDDRRHLGQLAAGRGEPLQTSGDHVTHAWRQLDRRIS